MVCFATAAVAGDIRVATFHPELFRKGPGLLLKDILSGDDPQVTAVRNIIVHTDPDILLLTSFDYDHGWVALTALRDVLAQDGANYPYLFAGRPNAGLASGQDIDGDGRLGEPEDALAYGEFAGQGGMALLSRFPIRSEDVRTFTDMAWADFPDALQTGLDMPLSSAGHWDVPVELPDGTILHLMAFHAQTPAFGGRNSINPARNHDEVAFWQTYLDGRLAVKPSGAPFVILGDANQDPVDGLGHHDAINALLDDPRVQDVRPTSKGAVHASREQGGVNTGQAGNPALDTADWRDVDGPGNLRVDYVLPSADLHVTGAGVFWPAPGEVDHAVLSHQNVAGSRHALVWVDIAR